MKNADKSAFPNQTDTLTTDGGLTKREYFAIKAPLTVPVWFKHISSQKPKSPKVWEDYPENDPFKKDMRDWHRGQLASQDIPEEIKFYKEAWDKYRKEKQDWDNRDDADKYFQWCIFYAENLLNQLERK